MQVQLIQPSRQIKLSSSASAYLGVAICLYTFIFTLDMLVLPFLYHSATSGDSLTSLDPTTLINYQGLGLIVASLLAYVWLSRIAWQFIILVSGIVFILCLVLQGFFQEPTSLKTLVFIKGVAAGSIAALCFVSAGINQESLRLFACLPLGALLAQVVQVALSALYGWFGHLLQSTYLAWFLALFMLLSLSLIPTFKEPQQASSALNKFTATNQRPFKLGLGLVLMLCWSLSIGLISMNTNLLVFANKMAQGVPVQTWITWAQTSALLLDFLVIVLILGLGNTLRRFSIPLSTYLVLLSCLLLLIGLYVLQSNWISLIVVLSLFIQIASIFLKPQLLAQLASLQVSFNYLNSLYLMTILSLPLSMYLQDKLKGEGTTAYLSLLLLSLGLLIAVGLIFLFGPTRAQQDQD
ncbi:MAG: hypothetical protein E6Q83_16105 [Thiothrix sp.]|nr:MAG: hypothetical protein E6Q83_16105 [Thiothrix sp.]